MAPEAGGLTPEQRADAIATRCQASGHTDYISSPPCEPCCADAIRDAMDAEREACAQIAAEFEPWKEGRAHDGTMLLRREQDLHQTMATGAVIGAVNIARLIRQRAGASREADAL